MTTMTMTAREMPSMLTIKNAMKAMGLGDRINEFLAKIDEMALDAMLERSIAAMDRGEGIPFEEFKRKMDEKFANGYYTKENARKRIESGMYADYL